MRRPNRAALGVGGLLGALLAACASGTERAPASGAGVGAAAPDGAPDGGARTMPAAPADASGRTAENACAHDRQAESEVNGALARSLDQELADMHARLDVRFDCALPSEGRELFALSAHGHGAPLRLLDARVQPDRRLAIRAVVMAPAPPTLSSRPDVLFARVAVDPQEAAPAVAFADAALAAHASLEAVPERDPSHHEFAITAGHDDEDLEFRIEGDASAASQSRAWAGHAGSLADAERMPLELAWQRLWAFVEGHLSPASPEDGDRLAFARLWPPDSQRRSFVWTQLLELAPVLGTADLVDAIARELDSPHPDVRVLAVNALAAITGDDRRRTPSGAERPLDAVVADYRARRAAAAGQR